VRRKQGDLDAAFAAYAQLARIDAVDVDGLPAALVARVGRASIFEGAGRVDDLRQEAAALRQDLQRGRWRLLKSEYEFYSRQADDWLGAKSRQTSTRSPALKRRLGFGRTARRCIPRRAVPSCCPTAPRWSRGSRTPIGSTPWSPGRHTSALCVRAPCRQGFGAPCPIRTAAR
jgi:hypothetical protein